ncbi:hypothetical protein KUTeg_013880 [Tegillarca granosa]|uniref:Potassium channel domain-containing protein n=1 Tax=Tegillarca granosa TaxID=220873 RepID=A0ABQ9EUY8_TEGGR|nr:hypothetical protein KUTeg_013880 [Tegillarca granosa]
MKAVSVIVLQVIVCAYVLIGGAIFWALESGQESQTIKTMDNQYQRFLDNNTCVSSEDLQAFIDEIITAYDKGILIRNSSQAIQQWTFVKSAFFAVTCVTTIGYGNQAPTTKGGRVFFMFYAIVGIAMTGLVLSEIGTKMCNAIKPLREKKDN